MNKLSFWFLLLFSLCLSITTKAQSGFIDSFKKIFPNATIDIIKTGHHFKQEYVVMIDQFLDHEDHSKGMFQQRIFLSHYDKNAPVVFVTEGYSARSRFYELSEILMANQIIVEYRFFGKSKPEPYDYQYLTNDQAMEDLHRIRNLFKKLYKNEWISTGISKGGTTCLIYRHKYPNDVKVAIPYVAPLPMAREDKRCDEHILSRGSEDCRKRLNDFQISALEMRDEILPMVDSTAKADSLSFSRVGVEGAFEYSVLEFTFSLWQWGHDCDRIKENMTARETFNLLKEIVGFDFYSDDVVNYFEPAFYQFMKENGYYQFVHDHLEDKIKTMSSFDNAIFGPQNQDLSFNPEYLKHVRVWLYHNGDKIIYIQGENDPWAACGMVPPKERDAILMTKKDGNHFTRIKSFESENRRLIYDHLDRWLKTKIHPLKD